MKKLIILSTFFFLILLMIGPGVLSGDTIGQKPEINYLDKKLKVTGSLTIGQIGPKILGNVNLTYKGEPFNGAEVTLGSVTVPQSGGPGNYRLDDLNIPINNQNLIIRIRYPSMRSGKDHIITIPGIDFGPILRIIKPDSSTFNPFKSKFYEVSWSENYEEMFVNINNVSDGGATYMNGNISTKSVLVKSSLFQNRKAYKFYASGKKQLQMTGPVAPGSDFYFQKVGVVRATCINPLQLIKVK